ISRRLSKKEILRLFRWTMESFCYKCKNQNRICSCRHEIFEYEMFTKVNKDNVRVCYRCEHFLEDHVNYGEYIV
ncbi:unnamed protein product, partial [Rotaria magnacalcarata]